MSITAHRQAESLGWPLIADKLPLSLVGGGRESSPRRWMLMMMDWVPQPDILLVLVARLVNGDVGHVTP